MRRQLRIIRVDPVKKTIVALTKTLGRDAIAPFKQMIGSKAIDARRLIVIDEIKQKTLVIDEKGKKFFAETNDGTPLCVAAAVGADESMPMWRLRGCEDTAGVGILFGEGSGAGMTDCPVTAGWVLKRIVWVEGENDKALRARALILLPSIDEPLRAALLGAEDAGPLHDGDTTMFLPFSAGLLFEAAQALGLTDEMTRGQRLTKLGAMVREILLETKA